MTMTRETVKKRVLFLAHTSSLYGASTSLLLLLKGLRNLKCEVFVVVGEDGPFCQRLEELGVPYVLIPFGVSSHLPHLNGRWGLPNAAYSPGWWLRALRRRLSNRESVRRIVEWARRHDVTVVYSNSIMAGLTKSVAAKMRLPLVFHVREFGDLDYGMLPDFGWWEINARLNRCRAVVYISQALHNYYQSRGQGDRPERRVEVIYNGACPRSHVTAFREAALRRNTEDKQNTRLGSIGALHPTKGHDLCIRGFAQARAKIPGLKLSIAGTGQELEQLRELCDSLNVSRDVEFLGYVEDVWDFYKRIDILLVASEYEAMGRVTAEGMAATLPIIGRNSGATAELIGQNERGKLFDGTANDLAANIIELVQDPDAAHKLAMNANQFAYMEMTTERYVSSVNNLIEWVMLPSS
jgi:glycosyltransferase involved in cell wall biosynthesis